MNRQNKCIHIISCSCDQPIHNFLELFKFKIKDCKFLLSLPTAYSNKFLGDLENWGDKYFPIVLRDRQGSHWYHVWNAFGICSVLRSKKQWKKGFVENVGTHTWLCLFILTCIPHLSWHHKKYYKHCSKISWMK